MAKKKIDKMKIFTAIVGVLLAIMTVVGTFATLIYNITR